MTGAPCRLILAAVAAVALAACGSAAPSAGSGAQVSGMPPSATPAVAATTLDGCLPARTARLLNVSLQGETLPVAVLGTGAVTVVLSEQSDERLCSWLPFARHLTARNFRVAVWDFGGHDPVAELAAVVTALRAAGDGKVVLAGASEGAKVSLIVAAQHRPSPLGVLSLSAEAELQGTPVAPAVQRLPCPALLITASNDPWGTAGAAHAFLAVAPPGRAELITVPGSDHGTALLAGRGAAQVLARIDAFLARLTTTFLPTWQGWLGAGLVSFGG